MKTAILILKTKHNDPSPSFSLLLLYRRIMRIILQLPPIVPLQERVCQTFHQKPCFGGSGWTEPHFSCFPAHPSHTWHPDNCLPGQRSAAPIRFLHELSLRRGILWLQDSRLTPTPQGSLSGNKMGAPHVLKGFTTRREGDSIENEPHYYGKSNGKVWLLFPKNLTRLF